ncbi:amidohydrolase family protein [Prosthecomicrobium sp. N25]|uniref:amidohydrolase family protein n=1 Tax=Prosthecomicrobium sp. N25 TaxID=3129254 RepID=UPI00307776F8
MRAIAVADALLGPEYRASGPVRIAVEDGRIDSVTPLVAPPPGPRRLALPAPADAHNHGRPLSTTSFAASGKPLESWLIRLAAMPSIDARISALAFFGHAALGGVGAVMMHQTRPSGRLPLPQEVRTIADAAAEVGIHCAYAVSVRDRNPLVYGPTEEATGALPPASRAAVERLFRSPDLSPSDHVALVEEVAAAAERPGFSVQFGPNGITWCTPALLEAIAEASARTGRRVHMHLLETRYQRAWADRHHPEGVVAFLKSIGLLSPRLTLAHCVWVRPDEVEMIAEAGATISVNTASNLVLASGIAPVATMVGTAATVALGLDNSAFDETDDVFHDLRLFKHLHAGWGFEDVVTAPGALRFAAANGRRSLGLPGSGVIAAGEPADLALLDLDALDWDSILPVPPIELVFTRATKAHLAELIVAGRTVVEDGRLAGLDIAAIEREVRAAYRAGLPDRGDFLAAWGDLEPALARFYRERLGCC